MRKLSMLMLFALLIACSDEPDPGDPNDFCDFELCASNATLKAVCIDEYNDCVDLGGEKSDCAVAAQATCNL